MVGTVLDAKLQISAPYYGILHLDKNQVFPGSNSMISRDAPPHLVLGSSRGKQGLETDQKLVRISLELKLR